MALLAAVAAQAATALENGRLYRQLRIKADELERMREFSENILESLNDGLAVRQPRTTGSCAGTAGSKSCTASATKTRSAAASTSSSIAAFLEVLRGRRRDSPEGDGVLSRAAR